VYVAQEGGPLVLRHRESEWQRVDGTGLSVPQATPSVETQLRAALRTEDLGLLLDTGRAVLEWARSTPPDARPQTLWFDDLYLVDGVVAPGPVRPLGAVDDPAQAVADAWSRFGRRLRRTDEPSPRWTPVHVTTELQQWLTWSGLSADRAAHLSVGRAPEIQAVAESAARLEDHMSNLSARVDVLRAALDERDAALSHRERYIRQLRAQTVEALRDAGQVEAVRTSRAYRTGMAVEALRSPEERRRVSRAMARRTASRALSTLRAVVRR
jgi:hypothetical protein